MGEINMDLFARFLSRSKEIAEEPGMNAAVVRVYNEILKPYAEPYLVLDAAVAKAESAWAKENVEALTAVDKLDEPFRTARAVALAYDPQLVLPETLKAQPTDTNKVTAVERLIDTIDDHAGTPWADEILAGDLGTVGPDVIREINEAIAANKDVAAARDKRAQAYGPAYDRFLRFKRVVRSALDPTSPQYKRIHGRSAARNDNDGGGGGGPTEG